MIPLVIYAWIEVRWSKRYPITQRNLAQIMRQNIQELFRDGCGLSNSFRLTLRSAPGTELTEFHSELPFALVGSLPECDVRLPEASVSRRHAYFQVVAGRLYCCDLDSRTGVRWPDGFRCADWISSGAHVDIGPARFTNDHPPTVDPSLAELLDTLDPAASHCDDPRLTAGLSVELAANGFRRKRWRFNRLIAFVGRSEHCAVRLPDDSVSNYHCSLVNTSTGVWVVDLASRNGVYRRGERVRFAKLEEGDEIFAGKVRLRFFSEESASHSGTALVPRGRSSDVPTRRSGEVQPARRTGEVDPVVATVIHEFSQMQQQMFDQFHQGLMMIAQMFTDLHKEQARLIREELDHVRELTKELTTLRTEMAQHPPAAPARLEVSGNESPLRPAAPAPPPRGARHGSPNHDAAPNRPESALAGEDAHSWVAARIAALETERQGRWRRILGMITGG